jgi:hypothetical protein
MPTRDGLNQHRNEQMKMNQLVAATQTENTALAVIGDDDPFADYANAVAPRNIVGTLLKFSKGDYLAGEEGAAVPTGTIMTANVAELLVGWVRWAANKPTDHIMLRVADGKSVPKRAELGDLDKDKWEVDNHGEPRDPWQFTNYLPLLNESGELFTFTTASRGGISAIGELCRRYSQHRKRHPDVLPIIALDVDSYQHKVKEYGPDQISALLACGLGAEVEIRRGTRRRRFCGGRERAGRAVAVHGRRTVRHDPVLAALTGEQTMSNNRPTFVATFDDGEITRMTVYQCRVDELDVGRGVRLARHAYNSRKRNSRNRTQAPPTIKTAHYENGEHAVLRTYTAKELATLKARMSGSTTMLAKALALARQGLPIFTCRCIDKRPLTQNGFKDASADPDIVHRWWQRWPRAYIGVPTGEKFVVIDCDLQHLDAMRWLEDNRPRIPTTRVHLTKSGGRHLLFKPNSDVACTTSRVGPHIDTRGQGGYIIWWPACGFDVLHPGTFAEMPSWVLEALTAAPNNVVPFPVPRENRQR